MKTDYQIQYAKQLKDPRWQKLRLQIFDRDQYTCMVCFSKDKELQVHHLTYSAGSPWETPPEYLVTTCVDCHKNLSDAKDKIKRMLAIKYTDIHNLVMCLELLTLLESKGWYDGPGGPEEAIDNCSGWALMSIMDYLAARVGFSLLSITEQ